jgi:lipid-A-disaccharide synthase-like uncharacterized protein
MVGLQDQLAFEITHLVQWMAVTVSPRFKIENPHWLILLGIHFLVPPHRAAQI